MTTHITISASEKLKHEELKRDLVRDMQEQQKISMQKLNEFFVKEVHEESDYRQLARLVVDTVDSVLENKECDDSLFLRNTVKPLKEMRERALKLLVELEAQEASAEALLRPKLGPDMVPIYILVFQSQGYDLEKWAQLLRSIGSYVLGRPVYESETDVQKVIHIKMSQEQEGYVKVGVAQMALKASAELPEREDRYGNRLLSLPAGSVSSENILEFVHGKKSYHFIKGELIDVSITAKRH